MGLSTLLSRGPRSLSAAHRPPGVEPPRTCHLSQSHVGPQRRVQHTSHEVVLIPVDRRGAQHAPVVRPPSTYGRIVRPGFEFSPRALAGPGAAVVEVEGFVLPGVLVCSARCHAPPRSSPRGPWPPLFAHVQINVPGPSPRSHAAHAGSRSGVMQAAERPADLAPVRFNC